MTRARVGSGFLLVWIVLSGAGVAQRPASNLHTSPEKRTARVAPGATTSLRFEAPISAVSVSLSVHASLPGPTVTVEALDGRVINQQTAASLGATFLAFDCKESRSGLIFGCKKGSHSIVEMPTAKGGVYTVHMEASPDLGDAVEAEVTFWTTRPMTTGELAAQKTLAQIEAELSAVPLLEARPLGKRFRFIVKALENGLPARDAVITFELKQPGQEAPLVLTPADDGTGADEQTGDGLYSVWFTPQILGPHRATATIGIPSLGHGPGTGLLK